MEDAFRWLTTVPHQPLPEQISPTSTHFMISSLVSDGRSSPIPKSTHQIQFDTNFPAPCRDRWLDLETRLEIWVRMRVMRRFVGFVECGFASIHYGSCRDNVPELKVL